VSVFETKAAIEGGQGAPPFHDLSLRKSQNTC
jgi:hypothetical protein